MSTFNAEILPPSDLNLINAFKTCYEDLKMHTQQDLKSLISIGIMGQKEIDLTQFQSLEEFKLIVDSNINIIELLRIKFPDNQTSITFQRRASKPTSTLTLEGNNTFFNDTFFNTTLYNLRNSLTSASTLPADILNTHIKASIEKDLSAASAYLKEDIYALKRQYERELIQERNQLQEDFKSKDEAFNKKVEEKEAALKLKEEEIERISNTDARRKIRTDLNKEIDQKIKEFGPSQKIVSSRLGVTSFFYIIIGLLMAITIGLFIKVTSTSPTITVGGETSKASMNMLMIEAVGSLITLIGFFIYFTRWKANWDDRLLEEEFLLKKYRLDMDRSSWLIESYLELQQSHQKELPETIVTPISTNLFKSSIEKATPALHPLEDLISALTKNGRIKLKSGKNEVEIEKQH